jgi:hypothetical protein
MPSFYPVEDEDRSGRFFVEVAITCYPYRYGHSFDIEAYPDELKELGANENTKFFLVACDETGEPFEDLAYDVALEVADDLNDRYHELLLDIEDSWEWERWPLPINTDALRYWK